MLRLLGEVSDHLALIGYIKDFMQSLLVLCSLSLWEMTIISKTRIRNCDTCLCITMCTSEGSPEKGSQWQRYRSIKKSHGMNCFS